MARRRGGAEGAGLSGGGAWRGRGVVEAEHSRAQRGDIARQRRGLAEAWRRRAIGERRQGTGASEGGASRGGTGRRQATDERRIGRGEASGGVASRDKP